VVPAKPKIFTNIPHDGGAGGIEDAKMALQLQKRLQKIMKVPEKVLEESKRAFTALSEVAINKIASGYDGCVRLAEGFQELKTEMAKNAKFISDSCKNHAFMRTRVMRQRFDNLNTDGFTSRFEDDMKAMRKTFKDAAVDEHMKNLSNAKWFIDLVVKLQEYYRKSRSVPLCCQLFLHVIMQMIRENIPLNEKTFYLILEDTITDKEEHKRSAVLHRVLKATREFVGIDSEKFLYYLNERGIQPNPLLLVQVRAIRKKRVRKNRAATMRSPRVRPSMMLRPSDSSISQAGTGQLVRKDRSSASLHLMEDGGRAPSRRTSFVDSEYDDDRESRMGAESEFGGSGWDDLGDECLLDGDGSGRKTPTHRASFMSEGRGSFISEEYDGF
jgi:hypothetical protein